MLIALRSFVLVGSLSLAACTPIAQPETEDKTPSQVPSADPRWSIVAAEGSPTARHEAGFIAHRGKLYLIGGRGEKPVDIFDPATGSWRRGAPMPMELHHFQPVSVGEEIWIIGAMTGPWPDEKPVGKVWRYLPEEDRFAEGIALPANRLRGAGGVAIHGGRLWWAGGIIDGHKSGTVGWLDSYDLATKEWSQHGDMPNPRDHFQLLALDDRLYAAGGRRTGADSDIPFEPTVAQGDIYDVEGQGWLAADPEFVLGQPRAGLMANVLSERLVYAGGESGAQLSAHSEVTAYNPRSRSWSQWPGLTTGRHGTGLVEAHGRAWVASGAGNRGGGPELTSIEMLDLSAKEFN